MGRRGVGDIVGHRTCQNPECGEEFLLREGGGRAKYCPTCRYAIILKNKRRYAKRRELARKVA